MACDPIHVEEALEWQIRLELFLLSGYAICRVSVSQGIVQRKVLVIFYSAESCIDISQKHRMIGGEGRG